MLTGPNVWYTLSYRYSMKSRNFFRMDPNRKRSGPPGIIGHDMAENILRFGWTVNRK
jgi:hypothetical protein